MVDVAGPFYKESNNIINKLSYLKNPSIRPLFLTRYKAVSSPFYYPYSNPFSIPVKVSTKYNDISSNENVDFVETQNYYFSSKSISFISQMLDVDNSKWLDFIPNNLNQNPAIHTSINNNCFDSQNSIIKSDNVQHHFAEQNGGIDVNKSSNLFDAFSMSDKCSTSTLTMISAKKIRFNISENSLFSSKRSLCEITSNFPIKSDDLKFSKSFEKNNTYNVFIPSVNNNALSLKYRKNIHYIQNNTSMAKRVVTPKRYIKWRKTNSCTSVHKMATLEKYKFMKTRSYPNISKHYEEQYSDTFLHNTSSERTKYLSKSYTSIFSKISNFSFCSTFSANKQDIFNDSYYPPPEKIMFKKKYTSLSKSFPILTKISNTKHSSRNIFAPNGKNYNAVPASDDKKIDSTNLRTQDKSLLAVSLFYFCIQNL